MSEAAKPPQGRQLDIPCALTEAIRAFPVKKELTHCGSTFTMPPFDFYAESPRCHTQRMVRACSAMTEPEEVFDAVFEWLLQSGAEEIARCRQRVFKEEK